MKDKKIDLRKYPKARDNNYHGNKLLWDLTKKVNKMENDIEKLKERRKKK